MVLAKLIQNEKVLFENILMWVENNHFELPPMSYIQPGNYQLETDEGETLAIHINGCNCDPMGDARTYVIFRLAQDE